MSSYLEPQWDAKKKTHKQSYTAVFYKIKYNFTLYTSASYNHNNSQWKRHKSPTDRKVIYSFTKNVQNDALTKLAKM